jgi:hypothetical protein
MCITSCFLNHIRFQAQTGNPEEKLFLVRKSENSASQDYDTITGSVARYFGGQAVSEGRQSSYAHQTALFIMTGAFALPHERLQLGKVLQQLYFAKLNAFFPARRRRMPQPPPNQPIPRTKHLPFDTFYFGVQPVVQ